MDVGKEAEGSSSGESSPGDQSVDKDLNDANTGIWQTNLLKIGITLIVVLISALWFCWNRIQEYRL